MSAFVIPQDLAVAFGTADPSLWFQEVIRLYPNTWKQVCDRVASRSGKPVLSVDLEPGTPGAPANAIKAKIALKPQANDSMPELGLRVCAAVLTSATMFEDEAKRVVFGAKRGLEGEDLFNLDAIPPDLLVEGMTDQRNLADGGVISGPVLAAIIGAVVAIVVALIPFVLPMLIEAGQGIVQYVQTEMDAGRIPVVTDITEGKVPGTGRSPMPGRGDSSSNTSTDPDKGGGDDSTSLIALGVAIAAALFFF